MIATATVDGPSTAEPESRGRNRFETKALSRVASAIVASSLGVDASSTSVTLGDSEGRLTLAIVSPIHASPLLAPRPNHDGSVGESILDRVSRARQTVKTRFTQLTGSDIESVTIRITRVITEEQGRVR
jgi:hypothetical protein